MSQPTVRIVTVTPAMARAWLAANTNNRTLSEATVRAYRRDMLEGRWLFAADPIRFSDAGTLLDGQHRLEALAGCPDDTEVTFLVATKLPRETQMVMDQGRRRRPGDQLTLLGAKDANIVAAGIRLHLTHDRDLLFRDTREQRFAISAPEIQSWFLENRELVEQASSLPVRCSDAPPSVAYCAALMFLNVHGADITQEFFRLLGAGAGEGHPINALDKRLQRIRRSKVKASSREFLALFIQAMNAWREGRTITKFQMPRGAKWTADTYPRLRAVAS